MAFLSFKSHCSLSAGILPKLFDIFSITRFSTVAALLVDYCTSFFQVCALTLVKKKRLCFYTITANCLIPKILFPIFYVVIFKACKHGWVLINTKRILRRNFSWHREKKFLQKLWYPLTYKVRRYQKFWETPKRLPTKCFSTARQKNSLWYRLYGLLQFSCSRPTACCFWWELRSGTFQMESKLKRLMWLTLWSLQYCQKRFGLYFLNNISDSCYFSLILKKPIVMVNGRNESLTIFGSLQGYLFKDSGIVITVVGKFGKYIY